MEFLLSSIILAFFVYYAISFNQKLHVAKEDLHTLKIKVEAGAIVEESEYELVKRDLEDASRFLQLAMYVACTNLMAPITWLIERYFLRKTGRIQP